MEAAQDVKQQNFLPFSTTQNVKGLNLATFFAHLKQRAAKVDGTLLLFLLWRQQFFRLHVL